jgi:GNAT superfamily N-acetyltransferase
MIRIRPMTDADLSLGMRLTAQAGWNQTEADWRRFLRLGGDGCFVAEWDGAAVGTTVCFVFGPVAWVAMVLVDEAVRGRGVGTALMRHALAILDGCGVKSVRLDATPLGRPLYEKLGFVAEYSLLRYGGVLPGKRTHVPEVVPVSDVGLAPVLRLDWDATQTERISFLMGLYAEREEAFRIVRRGMAERAVMGYLAWRPGANAVQIGPCMATAEPTGRLLIADACTRLGGQQVFIDVPLPNEPARRAVEFLQLAPRRELLRMVRGQPVAERVEMIWASSGPEKG